MKAFSFLLLLFLTCPIVLIAQTTTVTYTPASNAIPNPERGFYQHTETHSAAYDLLDFNDLEALRSGYMSSGANYTTPVTLILRVFYLENFVNSDISAQYLFNMQTDFATARLAGVKMIVRFAYTQDAIAPYNDAPKSRVLSHIAQLAPLLTANADIIAAVQMGFIGAWGEGYYTDHFGDPSQPPNILTATNWADRTEVLNALLAAVPANRQVQVRAPQYKQKAVYGPAAPVTSLPSGGRIGHHNDCFLATFVDGGTYTNYDVPVDDTLHLKPYTADDSALQLAVGGETCQENAPWHLCASAGGVADTELKRFHYSYLNADYNHDVNNDWTPCFAEINKKLGYRFVLQEGTYPNAAVGGGTLDLSFTIKNEGYAKPYNTRPLEFVLRNTTTQLRYYVKADANPQDWSPTVAQTKTEAFCLPADMVAGNYDLLLNMPDPAPLLYANPDYSIQLANSLVWENPTGYNDLKHVISISGNGGTCADRPSFSLLSSVLPVELIRFYGAREKDGVRLHWITGSEQNVSHFEIQRSVNGTVFETVGKVPARNQASVYNFPDNNPPSDSRLFYRLETRDEDGSSHVSNIIVLTSPAKSGIRILQNPVMELLQFTITGLDMAAAGLDYKIVGSDGRLVLSGQSAGEIRVSALPAGWYTLWVTDKGQSQTARFFKGN